MKDSIFVDNARDIIMEMVQGYLIGALCAIVGTHLSIYFIGELATAIVIIFLGCWFIIHTFNDVKRPRPLISG